MKLLGFSVTEFTQILVVVSSFIMVIISFLSVRKSTKSIINQNRAYVSFSIVPKKQNILNLCIQNTGHRLARNVQITTSPELQSNSIKASGKYLFDKCFYESIPPSFKFESFFDHTFEKGNAPEKYNITISYCDDFDKYKEKYMIDISMYKNRLYASSSKEDEDRIVNIVKVLKNINSELEKMREKLWINNRIQRKRVSNIIRYTKS